jgi:hypothetical protein
MGLARGAFEVANSQVCAILIDKICGLCTNLPRQEAQVKGIFILGRIGLSYIEQIMNIWALNRIGAAHVNSRSARHCGHRSPRDCRFNARLVAEAQAMSAKFPTAPKWFRPLHGVSWIRRARGDHPNEKRGNFAFIPLRDLRPEMSEHRIGALS